MRIQTGQPAQPFQVKDIFERAIRLEDYRGKKLMLSFYRYASCPLCNVRVHELIQRYPSYEKRGLSMLAVFQSPKESILQYVGRREAPFPIIANPQHDLYRAYRVESSWLGFVIGGLRLDAWVYAIRHHLLGFKPEGDMALVPADFLIGPGQKVEKAFYGRDIGDHIPLVEVEAWLDGKT